MFAYTGMVDFYGKRVPWILWVIRWLMVDYIYMGKNYSKRGYSLLHCTWPICLRLKYICLSIFPWWHCCSWVLCYETLQMLQLFSGFNSSLSYMDEFWQMRLTWSFPVYNVHMKYIERDDNIHTHKKYIQYTYRDTCLRHLYNIGLYIYMYGTISINRWGLLACWNDFFLPRIAWNSWTRWRAPCDRWHAPKIGHCYWWGQDIRAELVFVSLWDWVQKIEGFGRAL